METSNPPSSMSIKMFASLTRSSIYLFHATVTAKFFQRKIEKFSGFGVSDVLFCKCVKNKVAEECANNLHSVLE